MSRVFVSRADEVGVTQALSGMSESNETKQHDREQGKLRRKWRAFWRVGLGSVLVLAGIAMCVLPGPGLLTIIAGLALMADEVPLAARIMDSLKARLRRAEEQLLHRRDERRQARADESATDASSPRFERRVVTRFEQQDAQATNSSRDTSDN